ncbi:MAG: hypothetical protein ACODAA_01465 [Gemmatimonadota bacterium]
MILRLVWRSLRFAPGRTLLMLGGYSLGVGVMVALLSIGDAMVEQSRDRDLVGGGDLAVLPAGIDLETLRTGGVSSLYFDIELARFYYREVLTGPRLDAVEAVAPWLDDEVLYLRLPDADPDSAVAASAGGQIPSAAAALGVSPDLLRGRWTDNAADRRWTAPSPDELLREVDAFHAPPASAAGDSTWAEWHYFNLLSPDGERWLYLTYLVGGDLRGGRWGGQLLATLVDGAVDQAFERNFGPEAIEVEPGRVDVAIGPESAVRLTDGVYRLTASIPAAAGVEEIPPDGGTPSAATGALEVDLTIRPQPRRYLPAVDISPGDFPSGYAVAALRATAEGRICVDGACEDWSGGRAYHDHNWGTWGDVTWDWGQFQLGDWSVLYGGINRDTERGAPASTSGSRFMFVLDDLGLAGVLPIREVDYELDAAGDPRRMVLEAGRGDHAVRLEAEAGHVRGTVADPRSGGSNVFFQMRGPARLEGELPVGEVAASGDGFFETWERRAADGAP